MTCKQCIHNKVCPHLKDKDAERCKLYTDKSAYVKVVRCKDCKWYRVRALTCVHPYFNGLIEVCGFCSYGEQED